MGAVCPMTSCTVAVCTRGRPELLHATLQAAAAAVSAAGETELLVVEQGGIGGAAAADEFGARHVRDVGVGVSRARNLAVAHAAGDVILFTDDDCVVPETWVQDHRRLLDDEPDVAGSFGIVHGLPRDPDPDAAAVVRVHGVGAAWWDVGHGSNAAIRRDALIDVGGFDERIGPGSAGVPAGEDADLITRLLANGWRLASGTGQPVRHAQWRSTEEQVSVLKTYEAGAGVCIGAALRAKRPYARRHLKQRLIMLEARARTRLQTGRTLEAAALGAAFATGLATGVRLSPWPSP